MRPLSTKCGSESSLHNMRSQVNTLFSKNHRIVGRDKELKILQESYDRITTMKETEMVMIKGQSGSGKSSLVKAFVDSLPDGVFFAEGKFDELQSHAPFVVLSTASDQLCRNIMRRENSIEIRDRIRAALGQDISLLGNLVPTLTKITQEREDANIHAEHMASGGAQSFTRFKLMFRTFLRSVASPETPVILFLDDLQWADSASFDLLRTIADNAASHCIMLVCAYRENDIADDVLKRYGFGERGPMSNDFASDASSSCNHSRVTEISIRCLDCASLNRLLSETLGIDTVESQSLSTLVWNKTNGNPFYAMNFLDMLFREGLLSKDLNDRWTWNEDSILRGTNVAENLVDVLASRMKCLPDQVQSILQIASFIGHDFPAKALVTIVHEEQDMIEAEYSFQRHSIEVIRERIVAALQLSVAAGLLEPMYDNDVYKFAHDKIREFLYQALMPDESERLLMHQRIGTLIWESVKKLDVPQERFVYLAADNINRAISLVDYSGTRYDLIELNMAAAKLAIDKSGFVSAAEYLDIAVSLLRGDPSSWKDRYELCVDVFTTAAETLKNIHMFSRCCELVKEIVAHSNRRPEQCAAYAIEIDTLALQGDFKGSAYLGLKVLRQLLGVKFPRTISLAHVAKEFVMAKAALGRRPLPELLFLPEMTDENSLLAIGLMSAITTSCFLVGGSLKPTYVALSLRMFRLTLRFGISPLHAPFVIFTWSILHILLGQFDYAQIAERLSFAIVEKYDVESVRGLTYISNYTFSHFWRNGLDSCSRQEFLSAYRSALRYGHFFNAQNGFISWLSAGIYLDDLLTEMHFKARPIIEEMRESKILGALTFVLPVWQFFLNISGDIYNTNPAILRGEAVDDDFEVELIIMDSRLAHMILSYFEVLVAYLHEGWDVIKKKVSLLERYRGELDGHFAIGNLVTTIAICRYDLYLTERSRKHGKNARKAHQMLRKWATTGTELYVCHNVFLNAMKSLCFDRAPADVVEKIFLDAVSAAAAARNKLIEALANERLARFYLHNHPDAAKRSLYLKRAIATYRSWGALAKAERLENLHTTVDNDDNNLSKLNATVVEC